jgi:hypothetical protein
VNQPDDKVEKLACPMATRDLSLNLTNRQTAIEVANYGPLNPDIENDKYWARKAVQFKTTIEDAKSARCSNCAAFIQTPEMMDCIVQGLQGDESDDESFAPEMVNAAGLGFCELFDFKCAGGRTCDAWIMGGPITESVTKAEPTSSDVHYETIMGNRKGKQRPTDKDLYSQVKAAARKKFDVYPSAVANAWVVQEYKRRGGSYRTEKASSPAWQRKEGKNPKGGLNAKGRASYARETGGKLRPPVKRGNNIRRGQFLTRMGNMNGPERDAKGEPTRLLLSLQAWGASSKADAKRKGAAILAYHRNKKDK